MEDQVTGTLSVNFDRMRTMLARAAEIRADEQRELTQKQSELAQNVDDLRKQVALVEGFASDVRDGVGSMISRLGDLPDRTEVSVLAERLDEALAHINTQDKAVAQLGTQLTQFTERMVAPTEALAARLEGVAGRFEGVSGRLDGLEDRLQHLHDRLNENNSSIDRQQAKIEALPAALNISSVHSQLDELGQSLHERFNELGGVRQRLDELIARPTVDPDELMVQVRELFTQLTERMDRFGSRLNGVEEKLSGNLGTLSGFVEQAVDKLEASVGARPDRDEMNRTIWAAQAESERRLLDQFKEALGTLASQIESALKSMDNALASFAGLVIGGGGERSLRAGGRVAGKKSLDEGYDDITG